MKLKTVIFMCAFLLAQSIVAKDFQDTKTLLGMVVGSKGEPMFDAEVYLDSIKTDIKTNTMGYFKVEVPKGTKKIVIVSKEYGMLYTDYNAEPFIKFIYLDPKKNKVKDDVIIGYDKVKKEDLVNNVNTLDAKELEKHSYNTIFDMIRGQVAGVEVKGNKIVIRGVKTFTQGTEPLFVVDGVIVQDISNIPPVEVRYITFIKDSAASIYGSRGSNGVIEITLKR